MNKSLKKLRQRTKFFAYILYGSIGISVVAFIAQVILQLNGSASSDPAMAFWISVAGFFSSLWAYAGGIWLTSSFFLWSTEAIIDALEKKTE
ncbi:hypothetical protein [Rhodoluna limnophila]|uniref:hypothetical protein n=1 Tax=Rhodoluna limnophila TaxID=232537 RepID=UPI001105D2BF|nr:hypothetical protein [Rhodoluna limnophila]